MRKNVSEKGESKVMSQESNISSTELNERKHRSVLKETKETKKTIDKITDKALHIDSDNKDKQKSCRFRNILNLFLILIAGAAMFAAIRFYNEFLGSRDNDFEGELSLQSYLALGKIAISIALVLIVSLIRSLIQERA